jgi:hypothetical protein
MAHQLTREAAIAYRRVANIREYDSDYAGEREAHLHAVAVCRKQNHAESEHSCLTCLSYVFFRIGDWKRALATTRDLIRNPDAHPAMKSGATGVQAMIAAFRGQHRQALTKLEESRLGLRRFGVLTLEFHLMWAEAWSRESSGDDAGAARSYLRMLDLWDQTEDRHDILPGAVSAAAFFADAGELRQVARITDIVHTIAAENDTDESRTARLAVLAESAAQRGDSESAITHLRNARDGYDRLGVAIDDSSKPGMNARLLSSARMARPLPASSACARLSPRSIRRLRRDHRPVRARR